MRKLVFLFFLATIFCSTDDFKPDDHNLRQPFIQMAETIQEEERIYMTNDAEVNVFVYDADMDSFLKSQEIYLLIENEDEIISDDAEEEEWIDDDEGSVTSDFEVDESEKVEVDEENPVQNNIFGNMGNSINKFYEFKILKATDEKVKQLKSKFTQIKENSKFKSAKRIFKKLKKLLVKHFLFALAIGFAIFVDSYSLRYFLFGINYLFFTLNEILNWLYHGCFWNKKFSYWNKKVKKTTQIVNVSSIGFTIAYISLIYAFYGIPPSIDSLKNAWAMLWSLYNLLKDKYKKWKWPKHHHHHHHHHHPHHHHGSHAGHHLHHAARHTVHGAHAHTAVAKSKAIAMKAKFVAHLKFVAGKGAGSKILVAKAAAGKFTGASLGKVIAGTTVKAVAVGAGKTAAAVAIAHCWPILIPIAVGGVVYLIYLGVNKIPTVKAIKITEQNQATWMDEHFAMVTDENGSESYLFGFASVYENSMTTSYVTQYNGSRLKSEGIKALYETLVLKPEDVEMVTTDYKYEIITEVFDDPQLQHEKVVSILLQDRFSEDQNVFFIEIEQFKKGTEDLWDSPENYYSVMEQQMDAACVNFYEKLQNTGDELVDLEKLNKQNKTVLYNI